MPTIQRRHYEAIARIIAEMDSSGDNHTVQVEVAKHFASELRYTNPNFNRDRFLKACGVQD